jgi:hypothetical protein
VDTGSGQIGAVRPAAEPPEVSPDNRAFNRSNRDRRLSGTRSADRAS